MITNKTVIFGLSCIILGCAPKSQPVEFSIPVPVIANIPDELKTRSEKRGGGMENKSIFPAARIRPATPTGICPRRPRQGYAQGGYGLPPAYSQPGPPIQYNLSQAVFNTQSSSNFSVRMAVYNAPGNYVVNTAPGSVKEAVTLEITLNHHP